jgi:ferredoxin-type protein NapG
MSDAEINTSRRSFFSALLRKTTDFAVRAADAQDNAQQASWIRPPFALDELQFLAACTRCDAPSHGLRVTGTPVLDLQNKACHLCADWPCVTACTPGALQLPLREEGGAPPLPRLADVTLDSLACVAHTGQECRACAPNCPVPGALIWDQGRPYIVPLLCAGCALCREACVVEPKAIWAKAFYRRAGPEQY